MFLVCACFCRARNMFQIGWVRSAHSHASPADEKIGGWENVIDKPGKSCSVFPVTCRARRVVRAKLCA